MAAEFPVQEADRDTVGLLSVVSLGSNDDSTQPLISSPESLSAANWFSGGLSFKIIWMATAKECWREAGSPEEVLGWAFMAIAVQLALLTFEKHGDRAWPVHKDRAGSRLKGRNWPCTSSTYYDFPLFHWRARREFTLTTLSTFVACSGEPLRSIKVARCSEPMLLTFAAWSGLRVNLKEKKKHMQTYRH